MRRCKICLYLVNMSTEARGLGRKRKQKKRIYNEKGPAELTEECPWRRRMQNYKELSILTSLRQSTSSGNKGNEIL